MKNQKLLAAFALLTMLLASTSATAFAASPSLLDQYPDLQHLTALVSESQITPMHLVAYRATKLAMEKLGFQRGDPSVLALTNAGSAIIDDRFPTSSCLDALTLTSGCSESNQNLIAINSGKWKPLWFAFYYKNTGQCVYAEVRSAVLASYMEKWMSASDKSTIQLEFLGLSDDEVFAKVSVENIEANYLLSNPEAWEEKMDNKVFGGNEFSIMTIAACWSRGMPYELLKAAKLHNHICPGLISGILIIEYLDKNLPIEEGDQYYIVLAVPPWCKDDAFQAIYDSTVGKRRMTVMMLSKEQTQQLPENVAGIYVRWDKSDDSGQAMVLTFDWDKASEMSEIERSWFKDFESYKWWYARLKMDIFMLDYLDKPEEFVSSVKEFSISSSSELMALRTAGTNPYVEIGLMPPPQPEIPTWIYAIIAVLAIALVITLGVCVIKLRRKTRS